MRSLAAAQAYQRSAGHRSVRQQEADVFSRVNADLRRAQQSDALTRTRALKDNERLWITLMDLLRDPTNPLPTPIRGAMVSVGHTVRRELESAEPDLPFLIGINEQIAAGLSAT